MSIKDDSLSADVNPLCFLGLIDLISIIYTNPLSTLLPSYQSYIISSKSDLTPDREETIQKPTHDDRPTNVRYVITL